MKRGLLPRWQLISWTQKWFGSINPENNPIFFSCFDPFVLSWLIFSFLVPACSSQVFEINHLNFFTFFQVLQQNLKKVKGH